MSVVYVLTTPMPVDGGDNPTVEQNVETSKELWDTLEAKYMAENASSKKFLVSCIIDKIPPSWKDFKHTLKHLKEELTLVELGSHLRIEESLRAQDNDKPKGNNVAGPSVVNMVEHNNSSKYNDNKGKRKHHNTKVDPNKKPKVTCWKCGKPGHLKKDCKAVYYVTYVSEAYFVQDDDVAWWVDSGATVHVCKDRCWFKTYESLNDGSILHMENESTTLVHGRGCVDLRFSSRKVVSLLNVLHVPNIRKNLVSTFMSTSKLNDPILWHTRLSHVHFKRMQDMSKDGLITAFDMDTKKFKTCMLTKITKKQFQNVKCETEDEALDKFKVFKAEVELQQGFLIKRFRTDRGGEYMDTLYFQFVGIIHEMTAPYTLQQNGISERKNKVLKEMVNSMLSYSGLSQGAVVRLPNPKLETFGKGGIKCIFVGYAEHFKDFKFYVIEPNNLIVINSIIESRDAIFDEHRFLLVFRLSQRSMVKGTKDFGGLVVPEKVTEEDDPKTFDEAMKSQDVVFWKEAFNDEMNYIMGNDTWVLVDLPPGCRPMGCKWIFKRKLKVDGTVEKFKARLVIQGFKQNFLNGELDKEVYMNQPQGFIMPGNENKVDLTKEFLSSRFSMKDMGEANVILGIRIKHESNGITISQSHYIEKVLKKFNYFDCTPMYIGYPSVLEGYTDASWISNTEDKSSTSGWVFLLATGKEVEWLKNLHFEIPLWSKPIAPISIRCNSDATLAKAYSQMYNGKSRHLGVRHSMIRELITNGVVSIEFVRSQQNLADHLTKGTG
ncbi:zinc finger, CCHC-type containing protein [Tanacetum coccineum]|uniref:Zinc finger, CCHC-type containing protein n=1 Tax=Tanacetum coccineum TaxID=301880 RepID=A0ABQ5G420_9ASTR